jgi:ATP-dependent Clp protease ATP-binding subunit ClpB
VQLERVSKRLQDRQINLRVSESAIQLLSKMGYDPRYGARPVKRVIQQSVEDPLAQGILRGQYTEGCTVMVDTESSSLGPSQQPPQPKLTFYKLP